MGVGLELAPAISGVVLTDTTLSSLAGHLSTSGLSQADQGRVNGMIHGAGVQAGAFLHLSTGQSAGQALGAYAASCTDVLHTCAWIDGIGLLVATVISVVSIGVKRTLPSRSLMEASAPTSAPPTLSGSTGCTAFRARPPVLADGPVGHRPREVPSIRPTGGAPPVQVVAANRWCPGPGRTGR